MHKLCSISDEKHINKTPIYLKYQSPKLKTVYRYKNQFGNPGFTTWGQAVLYCNSSAMMDTASTLCLTNYNSGGMGIDKQNFISLLSWFSDILCIHDKYVMQ